MLNVIVNESLFKNFFRAGNEFATKILDPLLDSRNFGREKPSVWNSLLALSIGRAYMIDPVRARAQIFRNWTTREGKLKSLRSYYERVGDGRAVQDLDLMLSFLEMNKPPGAK